MKVREGDRTDPSPYVYIEVDVCVFFAQDAQGRLVPIKIVKKDTYHDNITRLLLQEGQEKVMENCVIPILDILDVGSESFYFIVMPRCDIAPLYGFRILGVVLAYMHCMLKDIKYANTIMHYSCGFYGRYPDSLKYTTL
ncbi:hypothetical protein EDD85DRAFT_794899 [Armillaria nabsnona]|nr:hypothetical protein EDD85DRAFT_794899 [Armillaria nabsnona]